MAHIPKWVLDKQPVIEGLNLLNRGKVRDTYSIPGQHTDKLLVVASDRISAFDFVLRAEIEHKGAILTALNHFWVKFHLKKQFDTDLVACGDGIDDFLLPPHQDDIELQKRSTVVMKLVSPDIEDIVRFHLTGSGYKDYKASGAVCGHRLPLGLIDGSRLPVPLYTPSTKAKVGHDVNISAYDVVEKYGYRRANTALMVSGIMAEHARKCGIIMPDTKLEIFDDTIIDEKGTPDCCRFWDYKAWEKAHAKGKLPPSLDKQFVREECKRLGIDKLDPKLP